MNARLDMNKGRRDRRNFRRLYDYFYRRLQEANLKKNKPPIEEVIQHLRDLRESWAEMLRRGQGSDGDLASLPAGAELHFELILP